MDELTVVDLLSEEQPASTLRVLKTEELEHLAERIRTSKERLKANKLSAILDEISKILGRRHRELIHSPLNGVERVSAEEAGLPEVPKLTPLSPSIGDVNFLMSAVDIRVSPYAETIIPTKTPQAEHPIF